MKLAMETALKAPVGDWRCDWRSEVLLRRATMPLNDMKAP